MLIGYVLLAITASPFPVSEDLYTREECESVRATMIEKRNVSLECLPVYR